MAAMRLQRPVQRQLALQLLPPPPPLQPLLPTLTRFALRPSAAAAAAAAARRHASSRGGGAAINDKARILEKPTRFNPPSHGSRRTRPRSYPGPSLSEHERNEMDAKRYPNMMPPEGTLMHYILTNRSIHLWITLSTLVALCFYMIILNFLSSTSLRHLLPTSQDWSHHPFQSLRQFVQVYKEHVAIESEKVAEKRRQKLADVDKRKEFMRAHGVEPGFLTGGWMDKFGTVESDQARQAVETQMLAERDEQSPIASEEGAQGTGNAEEERKSRRKPKYWFGIW